MVNNINKNPYNIGFSTKIPVKDDKATITAKGRNQSEECEAVINRIKKELEKAKLIAIKIIKENKLTPNEKQFISNKYPDIKKLAEQSKQEATELKELIKDCNSEEERNDLIFKAINNMKVMNKKGLISKLELSIKLSAIQEVERFSSKVKVENQKLEHIAIKLLKGERLTLKEESFIQEKFPNVKQLTYQLIKENNTLKNRLKNCYTNEEKQEILRNEIKDVESLFKSNMISSIEFKLKMLSIKSIEKEMKKNQSKLFYINPYVYINPSSIVDNLTGILIFILIIITILKFI